MGAIEPVGNPEGDWLARFVAIANRMQMATPELDPNRPRGARTELPEHKRKATEELRTILLTLRAHLTQAQIEQLLHDDNPDIRLAAATTLGAKNKELRLSAIISAMHSLSMAEVLESRRRARSKPPASPRLEDMGVDELVSRFVDAGERKALADRFLDWGTNAADRKTCDQRLREMFDVFVCMKGRGLLDNLRPLMDSENPRVRLGAAVACLTIDKSKAMATLEGIAKSGGLMERGDADLTLREMRWKSGEHERGASDR